MDSRVGPSFPSSPFSPSVPPVGARAPGPGGIWLTRNSPQLGVSRGPRVRVGLHGAGAPRKTRGISSGCHQVAARTQVRTSGLWEGRALEGACVTLSTWPRGSLRVSQLAIGDAKVAGLGKCVVQSGTEGF